MSKNYNIFIFFRDLRLKDNIGLIEAQKNYKNVLPIFVFVDDQIDPKKNKYFSNNSMQFLCESVQDLNRNLSSRNKELYVFHSPKLITTLESISKQINLEGIHFNKDYTPYSRQREETINKWCKKMNIDCCVYEDYLLASIGSFNKSDDTMYGVYGPFKNNVYNNSKLINKPQGTRASHIVTSSAIKSSNFCIPLTRIHSFYEKNEHILVSGNTKEAIKMLRKSKSMMYEENRNTLSFTTTHLSAYIKYGLLSIREVFHFFQDNNQHGLCDQLIWREFYFYVAYYHPNTIKKSKNYNSKYDNLAWVNNRKHFKAWCEGNTGYPVVDACMKQLNHCGYMHNRGRLISANFLNRMLGMDWRLGEKYFANKLTDYDPCVNNGNWQWIASTGVDPKPYFQRLFNPWLQSSKFDRDATYIKTWLPQLKDIPAQHLHEWDKHCDKYDMQELNYYKPIVNYEEARKRSVEQYRKVLI